MALTQAQYLGQQSQAYEPGLAQDKARKLQALKQARDNINQNFDTSINAIQEDYTLGTNAVNAETKRLTPGYQVQRNQVDATTAQRIQQLRNSMANSGLYRSGTTVSDESLYNSQGDTQRRGVDTEQNTFNTSQAGKIGDMERSRSVQLGDIQGKRNLSNQQYNENTVGAQEDYNYGMASARGQALNNWNQYNEQQQSVARAAAARQVAALKSAASSSATTNKAAAQAEATRQISAAVQGGMLPSQIQANIKANSATFSEAGLSISALNAEAYRAYQDYHKSNAGYIPM